MIRSPLPTQSKHAPDLKNRPELPHHARDRGHHRRTKRGTHPPPHRALHGRARAAGRLARQRPGQSATTPTTQPASPSPGAKVRFTNHDQTAHTATSQRRGFDTGTINPGHSAALTLDTPGTYTYYYQFHPFTHVTIIVVRRPGTSLYLAARVRLRDRQGPRGWDSTVERAGTSAWCGRRPATDEHRHVWRLCHMRHSARRAGRAHRPWPNACRASLPRARSIER